MQTDAFTIVKIDVWEAYIAIAEEDTEISEISLSETS